MNGDSAPANKPNLLIAFIAVIAMLYFGKDFFLPLVLAILISFLLAPLIRLLESWRIGRIFSVILATLLAFSVIGGVGYVVTGQIIELADKLPGYREELLAKVASLKRSPDGPIGRATRTLREVTAEFSRPDSEEPAPEPVVVPDTGEETEAPPAQAPPPPASPAVPVQVVEEQQSAFELIKAVITPLLAPLGHAAVVIVFVIFMLIGREDLRDRVIHLIGRQRLYLTTQALDDAGHRVSRYLLAQLIVNVTYGFPLAIGLYFIGIPNAILWGLLATILRFVPYIGPWIAASFPLLLSLAVSPGWTTPLLTLGLVVTLELISNNVVEPWLYGASTGLAPMAIIVSAVFWTWLWGPVGLLLATPLTVCIAVLGKYIPNLAFLDILLGDKPPIAPADRFYQRLLADDEEEVFDLAEKHVEEVSLVSAYENVVLPALCRTEADFRAGELMEATRHKVHDLARRLVLDLGEPFIPPERNTEGQPQVLCLPACSEADEIAALMLAQLLERGGISAHVFSSKALTSEMAEQAAEVGAGIICISTVPPTSVVAASYLCRRIRTSAPNARLLVGVWHEAESELERRRNRFSRVKAHEVFFSLEKAATEVSLIAGLDTPLITTPAPEEGGVSALPEVTQPT